MLVRGATGAVRLQRALKFEVLTHDRNIAANAKPNRRRSWMLGLVTSDLARIFGVGAYTSTVLDNWAALHRGNEWQVRGLICQLTTDLQNTADCQQTLGTSDLAAINSLLHEVEGAVDSRKKAPEIIKNVAIGNEFTFVNSSLESMTIGKNDDVYVKMKKTYSDIVGSWQAAMAAKNLPPSATRQLHGMPCLKYTFPQAAYGVQWEYEVTPDQKCVEIITSKAEAAGVYAGTVGDLMDEYVFGIAAALNLRAHATIGGGHINIDQAAFTADGAIDTHGAALVLAKFMHEFFDDRQHWQQMDPDYANAPFPSEMEREKKDDDKTRTETRFKKVETDLKGSTWTISQLADRLVENVFTENLAGQARREAAKYQALNVTNLAPGQRDTRRLEIRRVPAQKDRAALIAQLTRIAELLEKARS